LSHLVGGKFFYGLSLRYMPVAESSGTSDT